MSNDRYIRMPFTVEAVEITADNIEELAPLIGTLKNKEDGTPYILADKKKIPHGYTVLIGYWMTKMEDNIRCYSSTAFTRQFIRETDDVSYHLAFLEQEANNKIVIEDTVTSEGVTHNVFEDARETVRSWEN